MNNFEILQSMNTQQSAISKKFDFIISYFISLQEDIKALNCERAAKHLENLENNLVLVNELFTLESRHLIQNQAAATTMEDILDKAKMDQAAAAANKTPGKDD